MHGMVIASAPAKIILFGEHFVVYGKPAVAVALKKRMYAKVNVRDDDTIHISSPLGYSRHSIGDEIGKDIHRHIIYSALLAIRHVGKCKGLTITLETEFPFSMGLGASAASSICVIAGVAYAVAGYRLPSKDLFKLSVEAEKLVHRNPSGIDSATSIYGGVIFFKNGDIKRVSISNANELNFLIASTKIRKDTGSMVARVRAFYESNREEFLGLAGMSENITMQGIDALINRNKVKLGALMTMNHTLLRSIGVSNDAIDALVDLMIKHGAYGAKLTGAGGGGSVISLVEDNSRLLEVFKENDPFISCIEEEGVKIINNLQF